MVALALSKKEDPTCPIYTCMLFLRSRVTNARSQSIGLTSGDYVILTSDGITQNMDPQYLGILPFQLLSILTDSEKVPFFFK